MQARSSSGEAGLGLRVKPFSPSRRLRLLPDACQRRSPTSPQGPRRPPGARSAGLCPRGVRRLHEGGATYAPGSRVDNVRGRPSPIPRRTGELPIPLRGVFGGCPRARPGPRRERVEREAARSLPRGSSGPAGALLQPERRRGRSPSFQSPIKPTMASWKLASVIPRRASRCVKNSSPFAPDSSGRSATRSPCRATISWQRKAHIT